MRTKEKLRELIRKTIKEMSATGAGAGAGTFTPGTGAQYATPNAFNPNKKAKGAQNIYYYKLGWKDVPTKKLHKQSKTIDHKDLWKKKLNEGEEKTQSYIGSLDIKDPETKNFVNDKISDFDKIEDKLNTLVPLLKDAKTNTMEFYKNEANRKDTKYSTDLILDKLTEIITLLESKREQSKEAPKTEEPPKEEPNK